MDRELVVRARDGDRDAFEALGHVSAQRLYPVAYRILRDADLAEDAVQQTLVAIWREIPKLRDPDRYEAWAYRLVVRFAVAAAKRERVRRTRVFALPARGESADHAPGVADRDAIEVAFRSLSVDHRAVLILHHYLGLSVAEVAEVIGTPVGTAASRLHYATRAMRNALSEPDATQAREQPV